MKLALILVLAGLASSSETFVAFCSSFFVAVTLNDVSCGVILFHAAGLNLRGADAVS